jgi:hypothetical protein
MVEKIKQIIISPLFMSASCAVIGILLIAEKHPLYAGVAFGIGLIKFLQAFKSMT